MQKKTVQLFVVFGCLGLLVFIAILVVIFYFVFKTYGTQASAYMTNLCASVNNGGSDVNTYLSQQWITMAPSQTSQMEALIRGCNGYSISEVSDSYTNGVENLTASGTLTFSGGTKTIPLSLNLVKESGVWKLLSLNEQ